MSQLTQTNQPTRHVLGDVVFYHYNLSGTNGDTFVIPTDRILFVGITPTTAISVGCTISGRTITFASSGAWAAQVMVLTRVG